MPRGLNATQINFLNAQAAVYEYLVELTGTGFTSTYYTTGNNDVTVTTPTSGSQTFVANNQIQVITNFIESYSLVGSSISLVFASADTTLQTNLSTSFSKLTVNIYIMFRNTSTNVADTTNIIRMYSGYVTDYQTSGGINNHTITLQSNSLFSNFDNIAYKSINEVEPYPGGGFYWGSVYVS